MAKYNMTFEEAQEYISKRGFDIAWNDCDVFIDVRHITQAIGNILKWADEHPKEEPVSEDLDEAAKADAMIERPDDTGVGYDLNRYGGFISGAQWREEQMMKGAKLYGWIARDEDGTLHIFEDEPMRIKEKGRWWDRDYMSKPIEHGDFPDLKWEDEPIYVRLLIVKSE